MRFFILACAFVCPLLAQTTNYGDSIGPRGGRWGVRLSVGVGEYAGAIKNTANANSAEADRLPVQNYVKYLSAGWMVPLQLEGTFSVTHAFEVLLGFRYGFSGE